MFKKLLKDSWEALLIMFVLYAILAMGFYLALGG